MTDTKMIDVCALATITSGTVLCQPFSLVKEAAEQLLGHPVWTHEFVVPKIQKALIAAVLAQYPDMPVEQTADWKATRDALYERYGQMVEVKRGSREREAGPVDTLQSLMDSRK